jgi:hypothetical protein
MRTGLVITAVFAVLASPAFSQSNDRALANCRALAERAEPAKPQSRTCRRLLAAGQLRAARRAADEDAARRSVPSGPLMPQR